jgi:phosphonate transport system ATP-binding protein
MSKDKGSIRFSDASIVYPNGAVGMKNLDLTIEPGEFVVIVGSSGAGKSTLLRAVNGLNRLTSGTVDGRWCPGAADRRSGICASCAPGSA